MVFIQYSYLLTLFLMFNFKYVSFVQHLQHFDHHEIVGKRKTARLSCISLNILR